MLNKATRFLLISSAHTDQGRADLYMWSYFGSSPK